MANARMFPPGDGRHPTIAVIGGRSYTATVGNFLDVPTQDAHVLQANGWTRAGDTGIVGPTSARPASMASGVYFDTTLSVPVFWDKLAGVWRNIFTGAAA